MRSKYGWFLVYLPFFAALTFGSLVRCQINDWFFLVVGSSMFASCKVTLLLENFPLLNLCV